MPSVSIPDDIWSSFQRDQLAQRSQAMLDGLTSKLTDALSPPPAAPTPTTLAPQTGLPSLDALLSPFAPTAASLGAAVAGQGPTAPTDTSSAVFSGMSGPVPSQPSAPDMSTALPSLQSLPALGSLIAHATPEPIKRGLGQVATSPTLPGALPSGSTSIDNSSRASFARTAYPAALSAAGGAPELAKRLIASAISENGTVGSGGPIGVGFNFGGIKYDPQASGSGSYGTWESEGGQRVNQDASFAHYASPEEGFAAIPRFIQKNFPAAWAKYQQTKDAAGLYRDINAGGYATDPSWASTIEGIAGQQVAPALQGVSAPAAAPAAPPAAAAGASGGLDVNGILQAYKDVPYTYGGPGGRTQGLGALTDCSGFVSAVYQSQYGLNLAPQTDAAYNQLRQGGASEVSPSDARPGDVVFYMGAGTGGAITHHMGLVAGPGKVLDMSVSGADGVHVRDLGHAGQYVILRDPRLNAQTPQSAAAPPPIQPTGLAEQTGGAKVNQQQLAQAATSQPGGPPWTNAQDSAAGTTASSAPLSMTTFSTPTAQTSSSSDPGNLMLRQPLSLLTSGPDAAPTFQDDQTQSGYVQPDMAPGPPWTGPDIPDMSGTSGPVVSGAVAPPADPWAAWTPNQPLPTTAAAPVLPGPVAGAPASGMLSSWADTIGSYLPSMPAPTVPDIVRQAGQGQAVNPWEYGNEVAQPIADALIRTVGADPSTQVSLPLSPLAGPSAPVVEASAAALGAASPSVSMTLSDLVSNFTNPNFLPGGPAESVLGVAGLTVGQAARLVPQLARVNPAAAARLSDWLSGRLVAPVRAGAEAVRGGLERAGGAIDTGLGRAGEALDANAARVTAQDAARAQQPGLAAPGVFGVAPPEAGPAAEAVARPHFVPPEVREQISPNVEIPDDPRLQAAVQGVGGQITDRGVVLHVTRAQGPEAAGGLATRSGVFVEPVPEGGTSSFVTPGTANVGGSVALPATPTLYRKPLVISEGPNGGFLDDAIRQLGIQDGDGNPLAGRAPIDQAINAIRARTAQGSPERQQAIEALVSRYGGDPSLVKPLMDLRPGATESGYATVENIIGTHARQQGYDGVFYLKEGEKPTLKAIQETPEVIQTQHAVTAAHDALLQASKAADTLRFRAFGGNSARDLDWAMQQAATDPDPAARAAMREKIQAVNADPAYQAAQRQHLDAVRAYDQANEAYNAAYDRAAAAKPTISEVFDVQQGKNPTPPRPTAALAEAEQRLSTAMAARNAASAAWKAARAAGTTTASRQAEFDAFVKLNHEVTQAHDALQAVRANPASYVGAPGYSIHPDLADRVRPTPVPASTTAAGMAGVTPVPMRTAGDVGASVAASKGFFDRATPILSQGLASAVSGGVGAATADQLGDPNDPNRRLKGFVAGAALPFLASRGAAALARRAGREIPQAEGALASLGSTPERRLAREAELARLREAGAAPAERPSAAQPPLLPEDPLQRSPGMPSAAPAGPSEPQPLASKLRTSGQLPLEGLPSDPLQQGASGIAPPGALSPRAQTIEESLPSLIRALSEHQPKPPTALSGADQPSLAVAPLNRLQRALNGIGAGVGGTYQRAKTVRMAGMLSDTAGRALDIMSNVVSMGGDVATGAVAPAVDLARVKTARALGRQTERTAFFGETGARLSGMRAGLDAGWGDMKDALIHGLSAADRAKVEGSGFNAGGIPGLSRLPSGVTGGIDLAVEAPLRLLSGADALFRSVATGGHLMAESYAAARAANGGAVPTSEMIRRAANDPRVLERVQNLAKRSVLQEDRNVTDAYRAMTTKLNPIPRAILQTEIPFIRTPYNIMLQGAEMTPLGALGALRDFYAGRNREGATKLARSAVGTGLMAMSLNDYANDRLTGPRPTDPKEISTLPPGWQPWSRKITAPNGQTYYVPLAALGPYALPSVAAILAVEAKKKGTSPGDVLARMAAGVGQYASQNSFLQGFDSMYQALQNPDRMAENHLEQIAASYSPHVIGGGALGRELQRIMGMPTRDPHGAWEAIEATLPYAASRVAPSQDVLGRPKVPYAPGPIAAVARVGQQRDVDVIRAFRQAKQGLPLAPPKQVTDPGSGEPTPLTVAQQKQWQRDFGAALRDGYDGYGSPDDAPTLAKIEEQARQAANEAALGLR